MIETELPLWAAIPAAALLVIGGLVTLIGSIGLLRLPDFFSRMHGPSMGNTIGTGSVLIASMLVSSAIAGRPVVHELLITLFIVMTSPVTAMMLTRAAFYRSVDRNAGAARAPQVRGTATPPEPLRDVQRNAVRRGENPMRASDGGEAETN